jgi:hypothetical protein
MTHLLVIYDTKNARSNYQDVKTFVSQVTVQLTVKHNTVQKGISILVEENIIV